MLSVRAWAVLFVINAAVAGATGAVVGMAWLIWRGL
jgi:hypothetical protein